MVVVELISRECTEKMSQHYFMILSPLILNARSNHKLTLLYIPKSIFGKSGKLFEIKLASFLKTCTTI